MAVDICFSLIIIIRNIRWLSFLGEEIAHLPDLWLTQHFFVYALITEFTLLNFCFLKLKPGIFKTISDEANENAAIIILETIPPSPPI